MISCEEEGLLTQSMNVNAEPFDLKKSIRLSVANDTKSAVKRMVKWQLRNNDGSVIKEDSKEIDVDALSAVWLEEIRLDDASLYENYVSYQLMDKDEVISQGSVLFCPPKHFNFIDPALKVWLEGDEIVVSSQAYAKSVEIRNENDDLILSDNFFDLNGGSRRIKIVKGEAKGLKVRSVFDIR
jgi:beta-mannosidase